MQKSQQNKKKTNENVLKKVSAFFTDKLPSLSSQIRKSISDFSTLVCEKTQKSLEKAQVSVSDLKEYSSLALVSLFGFLMAIASLPQGIRPFGISAICSFSDKKKALCVYAGAAAACIIYGNTSMSSFIIYFMIYAARKTFTDSKFSEPIHIRILESAVSSMAVGIIRICSGAEAPIYSYIAFLSLSCISCAFTYFFSTLFTPELKSSSKMSTLSICSYALLGAIICSLDGFSVFGFDIQLMCACIITLTYAVVNGFLHAGIVGFVCGIACANPLVSACLGMCGIISAFLTAKSVVASVISFAAAFFLVGSYSSGHSFGLTLLPSVAAGCVLFFPLCGLLPESLRLTSKTSTATTCASFFFRSDAEYQKKLSEAFFSISDIFSKLAEKQKYPSFSDTALSVDKAFSEVCSGCALSEMCYAKKKTDMDELKQTMFSVLSVRSAIPDDFGSNMKDKCIRLENMCDKLNYIYRELSVTLAKDNRTALLSAQYSGMARLMIDAEKKAAEMNQRDTAFEKSVASALSELDITFSNITVCSGREKKTCVTGINLDKIPLGAKELRDYIYSKCGLHITEPSFDISEKSDIIMSFERSPAVSVRYSQACLSKDRKSVNGDTVNFLHNDNGYFHAFICDGMGSGKDAATSSRLASIFLEKMLPSNTKKTVILELLNNALMSRSTESFSTVDLLEADLLSGRCTFLKAGAAPTYILRSSKLYKIFSATPPVGIISGFTAESTRFDVEAGDVIIMMSDGVVQNNEDSAWLAELIRFDTTKDPSVLSKVILDKSCEINTRNDDMSVCVIKIEKAVAVV